MPRTHADYVRAAKLGWARRRTKAARRSLAGVRSWRGRRSSAVQKRAEAVASGRLGPLVKAERAHERPVPLIFSAEEIHSRIYDAAWAVLTGETETALELAKEIVSGAEPGYMFAIRAEYEFPDGERVWLSLTALTPLADLGVSLLAALEKSRFMLKRGHTPGAETEDFEGEVRESVTELVEVSIYLSRGDFIWE